MKSNWQMKNLGDVCIVERGSSPRPIEKYFTKDENGVNWIKIGDTKNASKYLYSTKQKITQEGAKQSRFVKEGDFILSNSMSFGNPFIMKTSGYIHDGWFVLRLPDYINSDYFYHLLTSPNVRQQFDTLASGAIVKNISGDLVKKVNIPLPPLSEQRRIVAILDEAFAAIARAKQNAEKNLVNARELFESYLQEVFANLGDGWEERKLGDSELFEIIDGDRGKNYPKKTDFKEDGFCLFMNTKNVRPDGFDFSTSMFITEKKDKELGNGKILRNDIVITTRGTIGNLGIYNEEVKYKNIRINSGMLIFRPNQKKIISEYFFELLRSRIIKQQIIKHVSGAAQPQLPIKTIVKFTIPVPKNISEQNRIVYNLKKLYSETKKIEAVYQWKIAGLDELKKSILDKAFKGELS